MNIPSIAHNGAHSSCAAMDADGAINAGIATHGLIFARHARLAHHASDTRQKTGKSLMRA